MNESSSWKLWVRKRGFLALEVGITVGAEVILIPENECKVNEVVNVIRENAHKGKKAGIIVAAEGIGDTSKIAREIEEQTGSEVRLSILGYAQRGGSPTARSRLLASRFAEKAVDLLCEGNGNRVVGLQNGAIASTDFKKSCETRKPLDLSLIKLAEMLAI